MPKHDKDFYLEPITFLVEDTLFKIPKHYFETSTGIFGTIFTLPVGEGAVAEGSSDEHPFFIQGISSDEFRCFLWVLYYTRGVFPPEHTFSKEDWISVLHLSTMWDFSTVRGIAIRELTKGAVKEMSHMEVILLARRFKVREWLLMGYKGLVLDTKVPTEDAEVLGWKTAYRILQLREDHKHLRNMAPQAVQATSSEYQRSASKRKRPRPSGPMSSAFTERLRLEELSIVIERSFLDELAVDGYEVESTVYPTDMIISNSSSNYYHSRQ